MFLDLIHAIFFFLVLILIFILNSPYLLISLVMLEIIGLHVIFMIALSLSSFTFSSYLVILIFCLLVLESVVGLVGYINFIYYYGSDFVKLAVLYA